MCRRSHGRVGLDPARDPWADGILKEEASLDPEHQEDPVLRAIRILLAALLLAGARSLAAQAGSSPSPTLPSDTLQANYAPRSAAGPTPSWRRPCRATRSTPPQPVDRFPPIRS